MTPNVGSRERCEIGLYFSYVDHQSGCVVPLERLYMIASHHMCYSSVFMGIDGCRIETVIQTLIDTLLYQKHNHTKHTQPGTQFRTQFGDPQPISHRTPCYPNPALSASRYNLTTVSLHIPFFPNKLSLRTTWSIIKESHKKV